MREFHSNWWGGKDDRLALEGRGTLGARTLQFRLQTLFRWTLLLQRMQAGLWRGHFPLVGDGGWEGVMGEVVGGGVVHTM